MACFRWRPAARQLLRLRRPDGRLSSALSTLTAPAAVTTTRTLEVPTGWRADSGVSSHVPLAMNDVYVLHEQLPYAYFFRETLSEDSLAASLERVLAAFPVLGGRLCLDSHAILLSDDDAVPLSIGHTEVPLDEWLERGHGVHPETGRPQLMPLFDPLPEHPWSSCTPLARVRVTHMAGGGTCLGINISHAAADGASCIRFVYCWGRQHRGLPYPIPANNRAEVTVNGMLTPDKADLMNLRADESGGGVGGGIISQVFGFSAALLGMEQAAAAAAPSAEPHSFLLLSFHEEVLHAMKSYGNHECKRVLASSSPEDADQEEGGGPGVSFVSTNDMVTSAGWMLMRQLSGNQDWGMNIVVNIRGRGGTQNFGAGHGLFGNGITAATATVATESATSDDDYEAEMASVAKGARAARRALTSCYEHLPERLAASQRGTPELSAAIGPAFCTTSWHFPLWELDFADDTSGDGEWDAAPAASSGAAGANGKEEVQPHGFGAAAYAQAIEAHVPSEREDDREHGRPIAFHGQPVHPLPPGETYAGIVVPTAGTGLDYQLFLPTAKITEAQRIHKRMCEAFKATAAVGV
jgi:hypothetical protein